MKDEILAYLQKHVIDWPEGKTGAYQSDTGEICFRPHVDLDFYPLDPVRLKESSRWYTREEWENKPNLEINHDNLTSLIEEAKSKLDYWEGRHDALCDYQLLLKAGKTNEKN